MLVVSGIVTTVFLGGWLLPFGIHPPGWVDPFVVLFKMALVTFLFIWVRATLPRLRYDQLMSFGWKVLLPLATLNALVTADARGGDPLMTDQNPESHRRTGLTPLTSAGSPGEDVIEVQRTPAPGAARGDLAHVPRDRARADDDLRPHLEKAVTVQYPEEKTPVYPRFRGRHKLHRFEDTGLEKCVGCSLCAAACPADCIRVVAAENTPENRVSAGERYAAVYEINLSRCIFCGYCEVACPFDAITMGHDYELSDYDRSDLIFTKEMLLAEPLERTPLRNEGE